MRVADEATAVAIAQRWLGLMQGALPEADAHAGGDVLALRHALPENRNALYDPRRIVETVADAGSVIELRREFGIGVITAVARLGGRAVAIAASQPRHLGGALDAPACDKLARFMQLADAHGLPLITFVDTPGFMVGPESEKTAMVRRAGRLFVTAASLRVPVLSVLLRRGYGLGAMALTAGHFHAPVATCAWPSAEFGPMGVEGSVRLGFRKELDAAPPGEREALFQTLVAQAIARGQALNMASHLEIDEVIDPAQTREWLLRHLRAAGGHRCRRGAGSSTRGEARRPASPTRSSLVRRPALRRRVGVGHVRRALHDHGDGAADRQREHQGPVQHHQADQPVRHQQQVTVFGGRGRAGRGPPAGHCEHERHGGPPARGWPAAASTAPIQGRARTFRTRQPVQPLHRIGPPARA